MLESLVSSRIRRALLEHILSSPSERFYLRGLAKTLNVSISPLRRELKRLEHSGMLHAAEEGNMLFYAVDKDSPAFLELARITLTLPTTPPTQTVFSATPSPAVIAVESAKAPSAPLAGTVSAPAGRSRWTSPLSTPVLLGASGMGMALMLIIGTIIYMRFTNDQSLTRSVAPSAPKAEVTVVVPQPSSSGVMRGARWQVVPGGFGGFSSGRHEESY